MLAQWYRGAAARLDLVKLWLFDNDIEDPGARAGGGGIGPASARQRSAEGPPAAGRPAFFLGHSCLSRDSAASASPPPPTPARRCSLPGFPGVPVPPPERAAPQPQPGRHARRGRPAGGGAAGGARGGAAAAVAAHRVEPGGRGGPEGLRGAGGWGPSLQGEGEQGASGRGQPSVGLGLRGVLMPPSPCRPASTSHAPP